MKNLRQLLYFLVIIPIIISCSKKDEVLPEVAPNLVGKWTIKTAKNFSTATLTAKASATIDFTETKYTVSQTQPFANYKNKSGVTEYLRIRNSTYKVLTIDALLPLLEADLKLFYGNANTATPLKNITAVVNLYRNAGIKYVAILNDASFTVIDPSFGTITVDISALGILNYTASAVTFETLDFLGDNQDISKTTFVAKIPANDKRGQILLEK